jgi:hypothetical protein
MQHALLSTNTTQQGQCSIKSTSVHTHAYALEVLLLLLLLFRAMLLLVSLLVLLLVVDHITRRLLLLLLLLLLAHLLQLGLQPLQGLTLQQGPGSLILLQQQTKRAVAGAL